MDLDLCFIQGVKFTEVLHKLFFWWYSDLISHTQTHTGTHTPTQRHTTHSGVSRLPQPCKYIFTPLVMTSQQLYHTLISFDDEPTLKDMSSLNLHALS